MSTMRQVLETKKDAVLERWLDDVVAAYPNEGGAFFRVRRNQFANPVGHSIREGTRAVLDGVLTGAALDAFRVPLAAMLRVRAVQEMSASQAVGFVLGLKRAIRAEAGEPENCARAEELVALEEAVDRVALLGFDLFTEVREELARVRIREMERHVSWITSRLNASDTRPRGEWGEADEDAPEDTKVRRGTLP